MSAPDAPHIGEIECGDRHGSRRRRRRRAAELLLLLLLLVRVMELARRAERTPAFLEEVRAVGFLSRGNRGSVDTRVDV